MRNLVKALLPVVLTVGSLTACAAAEPADSQTPASLENYEGQLMTFKQEIDENGSVISLTALITGTLTSNGQCLMVDDYPLVLPSQTWSWDGEFLASAYGKFEIGSKISVGGGVIPSDNQTANFYERCGHVEMVVGSSVTEGVAPVGPPG